MPDAISNTSPLVYLYRLQAIEWLPKLFSKVCLLDDLLARRTAQAAGLMVWGTLKVLLEAKSQGLTGRIEPFVNRLSETGMWLSEEIRERILALAGETASKAYWRRLTRNCSRRAPLAWIFAKRIVPLIRASSEPAGGGPVLPGRITGGLRVGSG